MPKAYPKAFRDDFGISEACLPNWLRKADIESGRRAGVSVAESSENRELRRRNRPLD